MNMARMLSVLMVVVLALGTGVQAGSMAGCMDDSPMIGMADNSSADAGSPCGDTGRVSIDAKMVCHGICMAPVAPIDVARAYAPSATTIVPRESVAWRDTAFSPDPHPPRADSRI
jgi:hypothetical protein